MNRNIFIVILVVIVIAVGGYFLLRGNETQESTPKELVTPAQDEPAAQSPPQVSSIEVQNQETAEDQVTIQKVSFKDPGYVVIHVAKDGKPGSVIGNSAFFASGTYQNVGVPVDSLQSGANALFAMVHIDDGDGIYEFPGDDVPLEVDGAILVGPFTATKTTGPGSRQEPVETTAQEPEPKPEIKEFTIVARQFVFEPDTITVNTGDTVKLTINSVDVTHGFAISEFGVNVILPRGKTKTVEFVASLAGTYRMFCSVQCGSGHSSMKGTLIVQ